MDKTVTHGFNKFAAVSLAALFACFLALSVISSVMRESFSLLELFFGIVIAAVLIMITRLSGRFGALPAAACCAILCLLLRLLWALFTDMEMLMDFKRYYETALALAEGTVIPSSGYQALFPHLLGYPAVLSVVFRIFGPSLGAAQALNIILDTASCLLLFGIASTHMDKKSAILTALIYALNPTAIMHIPISCSEPLYMFLMLLAIYLFEYIKAYKSKGIRPYALWMLLGFLTGIFNAVRPLGLILIIAFCLCSLIFGKQKIIMKLPCLALMLALYVLTSSLSYMWAEKTLGQPVAGGGGGWNLYVGMNTDSGGTWSRTDYAVLTDKLEEGKSAPEIQSDFMALAKERIGDNLSSGALWGLIAEKYAGLWGRDNAMVYWTAELEAESPGTVSVQKWRGWLDIFSNAIWWVLLIMCIPSVYYMLRSPGHQPVVTICLVLMAGLVLALLALEANARYHFPADALMALIAGWGCSRLPLISKENNKLWRNPDA